MSDQRKGTIWESTYYIAVVSLFLLSIQIPFLKMVTLWFLPLPFVILGVLQNRVTTLVVALFLALLSGFLYNGIVLYLGSSFLMGYLMGRVYREPHTAASQVVGGGMIGGVFGFLVSLYIGFSFFNLDSILQKQWDSAWELTGNLKKMGLEEPPPLEMVLPGCVLFLTAVVVLLNLWAARKWLSYKGFPGKYLPRFHSWNLPKSFFYGYVISLLWLFAAGDEADDSMGRYLVSFIMIVKPLFLLQGFSFLTYVLYLNKRNRMWVFLAMPLLLFNSFFILIELLGVIDVGMGLKRKVQSQIKKT